MGSGAGATVRLRGAKTAEQLGDAGAAALDRAQERTRGADAVDRCMRLSATSRASAAEGARDKMIVRGVRHLGDAEKPRLRVRFCHTDDDAELTFDNHAPFDTRPELLAPTRYHLHEEGAAVLEHAWWWREFG